MIVAAMTNRVVFGRFALDGGSLFSGEREIPLRPSTWAVLKFLAEHPDRLVSREELLAAAWPGEDVAADALEQSIAELRKALSDDGARLIVAAPGGYRFVPAAAPEERRKARGWHPLRWRWIYGILAPLLLALTVILLLLWNRQPPAIAPHP